MPLKQKIRLLLALQGVVMLFVFAAMFAAESSVGIILTLGFGTLIFTGVALLKLLILKNPEKQSSYFTSILVLYTLNSFLYLLVEPENASFMVHFSIVVFIIEMVIFSYRSAPTLLQIIIVIANITYLIALSAFPELATGYIILPPTLVLVLKFQLIALWAVGLTMMLNQLRKTMILITERNKAEDSQAWYSDLFSILSHNIRTPITSINNLTTILSIKKERGLAIEMSSDQLDILTSSNQRILSVVDEILNRDAKLKIDGKPKQLNTLLLEEAQNHKLLNLELKPWMELRRLALKEQLSISLALDVYLSNSAKFGATEVRLYSRKSDEIFIEDNGSGMTPEVIEYFGKPFNPYKSDEGSGLGTYFAGELLFRSGWNFEALPNDSGALIRLSKGVTATP